MADALVERTDEVLAANAADVDGRPRRRDPPSRSLDRLRLDAGRVAGVAAALRQLVALPDPVGDVVRGSTLPNGLQLRQVRVPLGVVGIVYEARPNVTVDAAGLCLKSGNAALLRGSASAVPHQHRAGRRPHRGRGEGRPAGRRRCSCCPADRASRSASCCSARGLVDVVIPRGGAALIERVVARVDRAGDRDRGRQLPRLRRRLRRRRRWPRRSCSTPRPTGSASATPPRRCWCTATSPHLARLLAALVDAGVTLHGDDAARAAHARRRPGDRRGLGHRVPVDGHGRAGRRRPARGARPHRALGQRAHRGHRRRLRDRRSRTSPPGSTPPPCWSTPRPGSPTAASSASAPRSASPPRSCTPAARSGLPELTSTTYVVTGNGHTR